MSMVCKSMRKYFISSFKAVHVSSIVAIIVHDEATTKYNDDPVSPYQLHSGDLPSLLTACHCARWGAISAGAIVPIENAPCVRTR